MYNPRTVHQYAVDRLVSDKPWMKTKKFGVTCGKALYDSITCDGDDDELLAECEGDEDAFKKIISRIKSDYNSIFKGVIPDAYHVCNNEICKAIVCYEIEDNHKINIQKLIKYGYLWGALDFYDWDFAVVPCDRYGNNQMPIDLCDVYYRVALPWPEK